MQKPQAEARDGPEHPGGLAADAIAHHHVFQAYAVPRQQLYHLYRPSAGVAGAQQAGVLDLVPAMLQMLSNEHHSGVANSAPQALMGGDAGLIGKVSRALTPARLGHWHARQARALSRQQTILALSRCALQYVCSPDAA